ncbi:MAG: hypothetical protein IKL10_09745 [Clostridia bacterium]|nr:hypothetical protein [Clostridia bacterium]
MTEKLYYNDSHLIEFEAKIVDIFEENRRLVLILDKTAFFPEGGGQLYDIGFINQSEVVEVQEKEGQIYHYLKDTQCNFQTGDSVTGKILWELRFKRMQAHSGEHIISGVAHNLFGADNVGFHMDNDNILTIDFNIYLTKAQVSLLEQSTNDCIYKNLEIRSFTYAAEDIKNIDFRSKLEFTDSVRIVEIDGVDKCACCAPHVKYTGEIGLIKILSCISHRGGVRLTAVCGADAFEDYIRKYDNVLKIASQLCAKHNEVSDAVEVLLQQNSSLKRKITEINSKHLNYVASLVESADVILRFYEDFSIEDLRELSNLLKDKCKIAVILLSGNNEIGYSYSVYSEKMNLSLFAKAFNLSLDGTGGGRGSIIQGKVKSNSEQITEFVKNMRFEEYENA